MANVKVKRVNFGEIMENKGVVVTEKMRYLQNIGCLMDIPVGKLVKAAAKDDDGKPLMVINGGLSPTTGILGRSNLGKTTLLNYMLHTAASRTYSAVGTSINTNDTENTFDVERQATLAARNYPGYHGLDIIEEGIWIVTDKLETPANVWFKQFLARAKDKQKRLKSLTRPTYILDDVTGKPYERPIQTYEVVDSVSELDAEITDDKLEKAEIGSTDAQTIYMNLGLQRTNMLKVIPKIMLESGQHMLLTAHVDDKINMAAGPGKAPPPKQLATLRAGDVVKGMPSKAFFLLGNVFQVLTSTPFIKSDTRTPMLPKDTHDNNEPSKDLVKMNVLIARSKHGGAGYEFNLLSSQEYGILPNLTNYHYTHYVHKGFGEGGAGQSLFMVLYPEVKFSRTTIRAKLESDPLLARAVEMTADIHQLRAIKYDHVKHLELDPKKVYENLVAKGYDMSKLLATRNWHTIENHAHDSDTLHTFDVLRLASGDITLKKYKVTKEQKPALKEPKPLKDVKG